MMIAFKSRLLLATLCVFPQVLAAQGNGPLTVARIWGSSEFASELVAVRWIDDRNYTATESNGDLIDLYRVDASTGARELLVSGSELVPPGEAAPIVIEGYQFSTDNSRLLIFSNSERVWRQNTKGEYFVWDFAQRRLMRTTLQGGYQQFAKLTPDGESVVFVRDNDLFITQLATGDEQRITTDGSENVINGTADWVYEEELGLRDAFRVSPDGKHVAFWRLDQTSIKSFYLIDELQLYPELIPVRYPKAGEDNSEVRLGIANLETGEITWVGLGDDRDIYIAQMDFADSSDEIWFTRLNRHQSKLELLLAEVQTGESHVIMTDTDDAWVNGGGPTWIDDGNGFLYSSDRDGYTQVFHYNRDGSLVGKVTTENWDVRQLYGVDEDNDVIFFAGNKEGPLESHIYSVALDGSNLQRISTSPGTHRANFSTDFGLYVDTYSTAANAPVQTLYQVGGTAIRTVATNEALKRAVDQLGVLSPEFIRVPAADGSELNAYMIRPPDFDPSRRYPLLMYVYGGPGSQTVSDSWGGERYLWHQMLAQQGYLVASVDNRGTGGRGAEFMKQTYLRLGQDESADQISAARHFASLPYVDGSRIGIWGWSYGGYMSSLSMLRGAGAFRAAIVVAPVTDWRLYDTIYTERYMRTPQENPDGYRTGAPTTYADQLQGDLLLVHGTGDDNVHSQQTTRLVEALIEADKQFDMRVYPNRTHSIAGGVTRVNLYSLFTSWLWENLYNADTVSPIP